MSDRLLTDEIDREFLAGKIDRWTLSQPLSESSDSAPAQQRGRLIELRGEPRFQIASRRGRQEFHENLTVQETLQRLADELGTTYGGLHLFGAGIEWELRRTASSELRVVQRTSARAAKPKSHDRRKASLIPDDVPVPFLIEVGLMTTSGRIKPQGVAKFRQINRYLEFVKDVLPSLPTDRPLKIVDFGCGKSYLTFALHYWLTEIEHRAVEMIGLDRDPQNIKFCNALCEKLSLSGISFSQGEIHTFDATDEVDLVVSLHACDTATDDAIIQAVRWNARVIFAVPCCQHELDRQISPAALNAVTQHGILRTRFAADATDALRALALEARGYRTQIVEFIETEHTPKNLLIRAILDPAGQTRAGDALSEYRQFKEFLGLDAIRIDGLISVSSAGDSG